MLMANHLVTPPPPKETHRVAFMVKNGHQPRLLATSGLTAPVPVSATALTTRIIRLKRIGSQALGFSIRGGWEHGTGVFVSEVHRGSEAEKQGLMAGDQILRVNSLSIDKAIHEEVISLIKSTPKVTLKVKSVGMLPIKDHREDCLSWRLLDQAGSVGSFKPCPVHNKPTGQTGHGSDGSWSATSSSTSSRRSSSSQRSDVSDHALDQELVNDEEPIEECQVFLSLDPGQGLGCSVVKGPAHYPGIFVQSVKGGGVAFEAGLELGDQIVAMNGTTFGHGNFGDAIARIKSANQMTLTVRKRVGLNLFNGSGNNYYEVPSSKTIHKIRALVHHPSSVSQAQTAVKGRSPLCPKHSNPLPCSTYETVPELHYAISEDDSSSAKSQCKVHPNRSANKMADTGQLSEDASEIMLRVKKEEERLADERRKLEEDQNRLRVELDQLDKERKQLEKLRTKAQDGDVNSLSADSMGSASTSSGNHSISDQSSESGAGTVSSGSSMATSGTSQMGFLDELKKLAERRSSSSDGLLTDTLNKTKMAARKLPALVASDEKRKQHELLMEEFKSAHNRMFGRPLKESDRKVAAPVKKPVTATVSAPAIVAKDRGQEVVNDSSEKVTILRTSSPTKKHQAPPPPPPPLPPGGFGLQQEISTKVSIGSYAPKAPNRFAETN